MHRRAFLRRAAAGAVLGAGALGARADSETLHKKTYVYKSVGKCAIKADVYRPADEVLRPVALWIHGGALIMGDRGGIDRALREALLRAGYILVSIDYRLAPETKLPEILEDVQD